MLVFFQIKLLSLSLTLPPKTFTSQNQKGGGRLSGYFIIQKYKKNTVRHLHFVVLILFPQSSYVAPPSVCFALRFFAHELVL